MSQIYSSHLLESLGLTPRRTVKLLAGSVWSALAPVLKSWKGPVTAAVAYERKVSQVPPEELELALKLVVRDATTIDEPTLIKQAAAVFGWLRVRSDTQDVLSQAIKRLLNTGVLILDGHGDLSVAPEA